MRSRGGNNPPGSYAQGKPGGTSARALGGLVFLVLMIGTVSVVYVRGGPSVSPRSGDTHETSVDALAAAQHRRSLAQRQRLLAEARGLLTAIEEADERIEGARKVLERFAQEGGRNNGGAVSSAAQPADDETDVEHVSFPLSRYERLRHSHAELVQYLRQPLHVAPAGTPGSGDNASLAPAAAATDHPAQADARLLRPTIFIGLASHRHNMCAAVVSNIFRHATAPRRVYIGLVEIHGDKDARCMPQELTDCQLNHFCITDHVRTRDLDPPENKGLAHARYLASLLYRGQDFVMFAAVPTFFAPIWDVQLVAEYEDATALAVARSRADATKISSGTSPDPLVVLTTAPENVDATTPAFYPVLPVDAAPLPPVTTSAEGQSSGMVWERSTMASLCRAEYQQPASAASGDAMLSPTEAPGVPPKGIPSFSAVVQKQAAHATHQPWASMKFIFANATLLRDVPLDPHLLFVERESEEDALYSARLWAEGWEAYSPRKSVVFQWKNGEEVAGTLATDVPSAQLIAGKKATFLRMQYLMQALQPGSRDPIVPDDVVLHEVVVEGMTYGVRWNAGAGGLPLPKQREEAIAKAAVDGQFVPVAHRTLERWYRYGGLNPSSYTAGKQWCQGK